MQKLKVRKLQVEDHEEVISMSIQFYDEDQGSVSVDASNMKRTIQHWNEFPNGGCIYTFHLGDVLVGYANFIFYWSNEYGGQIVNLDELFIRRDYRGIGIGLEFLNRLDSLFADSVAGYELEVHPGNKGVMKLYEKAGFSINENTFMLKLKLLNNY